MSALSIQPTYPIFTDIDGQPLEAGYLWLGVANLNPQTNPINVYWDADLTIPATQPIRTLAGYPSNSGTPARLYVNSDYSIRVMNRNGSTIYSAPENLERFGNINASTVTYTPPWTNSLPSTVAKQLDEVIYVDDFIPAGTNTAVTDCTAYIQSAINAANQLTSRRVLFSEKSYRIDGTVQVTSHLTVIDGRGCELDYYGSSVAFDFVPVGGTIYPVSCNISNIAIRVRTATSGTGFRMRTSYSVLENLAVVLYVAATNARGFTLVGDEANGTGPYYNQFYNCGVQSQSGGTAHIGISFVAAAPSYRAPNANTFYGGRVGQCLQNYVIKGNGNAFYNPTSENGALAGTSFKFEADTPVNCVQNQIFGAYVENAATAFLFSADSANNSVYSPFMTGVATTYNDLGVSNLIVDANVPAQLPYGVNPNGNASSNPEVLDSYEEGTWIPTLVGGTTAGSYTITTSSAKYIKIGRQVTVTAKMDITVNSAGTGALRFGGLPFPKDSSLFMAGGVITQNISINAAIMSLSPSAWTSSLDSTFAISGPRSGAAPLELDCADVSASAYVIITITYITQS
jgi:hypothetical protein